VKRTIYLAMVALVASMILVSPALAQDEDTMMPERNAVTVGSVEEITQAAPPLPNSGGPAGGSVLLPAAALLLGSGVLGYAVLRRR
jgi:hypothetical protein